MRQGWQELWQPFEQQGQPTSSEPQMLPLTAVAARLGIGVFASGPLSEAGLLQDSSLMVGFYAHPVHTDVVTLTVRIQEHLKHATIGRV
jgi:hypothetical protein